MRVEGMSFEEIGIEMNMRAMNVARLMSYHVETEASNKFAENERFVQIKRYELLLTRVFEDAQDGDRGALDKSLAIMKRIDEVNNNRRTSKRDMISIERDREKEEGRRDERSVEAKRAARMTARREAQDRREAIKLTIEKTMAEATNMLNMAEETAAAQALEQAMAEAAAVEASVAHKEQEMLETSMNADDLLDDDLFADQPEEFSDEVLDNAMKILAFQKDKEKIVDGEVVEDDRPVSEATKEIQRRIAELEEKQRLLDTSE